MRDIKYIVGIDEVGRGPLAGPVTIGLVCFFKDKNYRSFFPKIRDSKKLSPKSRAEWFKIIKKKNKLGHLKYLTSSASSTVIDKIGISKAISLGIKRSLSKLKLNPLNCQILLDGGLKAPREYFFQETIIKGDEKKKVIALASIVAKVTRDNKMTKLNRKFPKYGFEKHKGYGTKLHLGKIKSYGITSIHRKSFCQNYLDS